MIIPIYCILTSQYQVDQLVKFNQSLIDNSSTAVAGTKSVIDGILLTKFDCIDDKVCKVGAIHKHNTLSTAIKYDNLVSSYVLTDGTIQYDLKHFEH